MGHFPPKSVASSDCRSENTEIVVPVSTGANTGPFTRVRARLGHLLL